jgi:hypothetical protein
MAIAGAQIPSHAAWKLHKKYAVSLAVGETPLLCILSAIIGRGQFWLHPSCNLGKIVGQLKHVSALRKGVRRPVVNKA